MRTITGIFYNGQSSARHPCNLYVDDNHLVQIDGIDWQPCQFDQLTISSRLGNTPRIIQLPGGSFFESDNNNAIDQLIKRHKTSRWPSIHEMESSLIYIAVAVIVMCSMAFGAITWGLPFVSKQIAYSLPAEVSNELADGVLSQLDRHYFERTKLEVERRKELTELFEANIPEEPGFHFRLHFRDGGAIGANALALPDGSVVMTDQLVELADNDSELLSVLLHEIGHVTHRHSLRQTIQGAGLVAIIAWFTGDLEAVSSWLLYLPAVIIQADYSRNLEWEADTYALKSMKAAQIDPVHFANFMSKLDASHRHDDKEQKTADDLKDREKEKTKADIKVSEDAQVKEDETDSWFKYLSSHPPTRERIDRFQQQRFSESANSAAH